MIAVRAGIFLFASACWVLLLEGVSRAWIARRGDALDATAAILRADARLGWVQRGRWRGTFQGKRLATNEAGFRASALAEAAEAGRRVLVLGPSSAFGWGVAAEETYAQRLEEALVRRFPHESASVVNAGVIGYSSWQGLALWHSGLLRKLKPQAVVVAYGANDPDLHRFFFAGPGTDAETLGPGQSPVAVRFQNALKSLRLFHVGTRLALQARDALSCAGALPRYVPSRRVSLPEFEATLGRFVREIRGAGAVPVFVTTAFRFPAPPGPPDCQVERDRAAALARAGDCAGARAAAGRALRCEPGRLGRDLKRYNAAMRAVARVAGVPLVDAERLLNGEAAANLLDAVHPTPRGHAIIAEELERLLAPLWNKKK